MYRESPDEVARRHVKLRARLDELRPQLSALREIEREARTIEQLMATESAAVERRLLLPLLDNLRIASPCLQSWEEMSGDGRVRFCRRCSKNVYNLSALSREQAEALVLEREGAVCLRFYRRDDGTVLTADCPTGRRRVQWFRSVFAALAAGVLAAVGIRGGKPSASVSAPTPVERVGHGLVKLTPRSGWGHGGHAVQPKSSHFTGFEILDRNGSGD